MINCKAFYKAQTASCLKGNHSSFPSLRLWSKTILTEINKNIRTFTFKVLQGCTSWASRNGAVQMFFSDNEQKHVYFAGKSVKSVSSLAVLREHIIFNAKWIEVHKMREVFRAKLWIIFFASFCWLWQFLLKNLKLKKNSDDVHWIVWKNIKQLYTWKNVFKKNNSK